MPLAGCRPLKTDFFEIDGLGPCRALIATDSQGREDEPDACTTLVFYSTKPPSIWGNQIQERHMIRCLEVPAEVDAAYIARPC